MKSAGWGSYLAAETPSPVAPFVRNAVKDPSSLGVRDKSKMSNRSKGNRLRRKVADWYERRGCLVYVVPETRWSKDIFGIGDLLVVGKDYCKIVQVKSRQNFAWDDYIDIASVIPRGVVIEFWIGMDRFYRWNPNSQEFKQLEIEVEEDFEA